MELHNRIAEISLDKFASLPKTGKPNLQEWTVMSTIVKHDASTDNLEVLSLGTGSKCIGANFMSPNGDILNDSHAEIICRRAFIKYMYIEIDNYLQTGDSDIFVNDEQSDTGKCTIKQELTFHIFSTHVPCGDASIFAKNEKEDFGTCLVKEGNSSKENVDLTLNKTSENILEKVALIHKNNDTNCNEEISEYPPSKKMKVVSDIYRTGAKCLKEDSHRDPKKSGSEYHVLGAVRIKPGRGDPTLSVSCSDKIAKWTLLGIQGAFLFRLLHKPVYLTSITIAGGVPFSQEAMKRAICERTETALPRPFKHSPPKIAQAKSSFEYCKIESKQPCPSSIIWFKNCKKIEVAVEGRKQGVTKKNKNTKSGRLSTCKKELYSNFCNIAKKYPNIFDINIDNCCYLDWKSWEHQYFEYSVLWNQLKNNIFNVWPSKSKDLLLFTCTD